MQNVIIISNDECLSKIIKNIIFSHYGYFTFNVIIQKICDVTNHDVKGNTIYFIDVDNYKNNILDIVLKIRMKDKGGHIVALTLENTLKSILESQSMITACLQKNGDFNKQIIEILLKINSGKNDKFNLSEGRIPIYQDFDRLNGVLLGVGGVTSVRYKNKDTEFTLTFKNPSNKLKEMVENKLYTDKKSVSTSKNSYDEWFKQMVVDLYLIYKIDHKMIAKSFNINPKYIKYWSRLSKYCRKPKLYERLFRRYVHNQYLKSYINIK